MPGRSEPDGRFSRIRGCARALRAEAVFPCLPANFLPITDASFFAKSKGRALQASCFYNVTGCLLGFALSVLKRISFRAATWADGTIARPHAACRLPYPPGCLQAAAFTGTCG